MDRMRSNWWGKLVKLGLGFGLTAGMVGCAPQDTQGEDLEVECDEGKCDGWDTLKAFVKNPKDLRLTDLLSVSTGYFTDALNSRLRLSSSWGGLSAGLGKPAIYGTSAQAAGDLTIKNLDTLVAGLASAYGERDLTTQINRVRQETLSRSPGSLYGEAQFKIGANLGHAWSMDAGGLGISVGFNISAELQARTIGLYKSESSAILASPLELLASARRGDSDDGFILPRSKGDVALMKAGESFALKAPGTVAFSLGMGMPVASFVPIAGVVYRMIFSFGAATTMSGTWDLQVMKLAGDEVVVDYGVSNIDSWKAAVALSDEWGVQGLLNAKVSLGGREINLAGMVDRVVEKQLNDKLHLFKAAISGGKSDAHMSVARLRFFVDKDDAAGSVEKALAQALHGDLRLAQALAAQGHPGVRADFDLSRAGVAATFSAGVDIFGMSFFYDRVKENGTLNLQTPGGARSMVWDSLRKEKGMFFSKHGFQRTGLGGLIFDGKGDARGEANLVLTIDEASKFISRDKLLDNLDGVITGLGGKSGLRSIEGPANQLERIVTQRCPSNTWGSAEAGVAPADFYTQLECNLAVLNELDDASSEVAQRKAEAMAAIQAVASTLAPEQQTLLTATATQRVAAQLANNINSSGPKASLLFDVRIDDAALSELMSRSGEDLKRAVVSYLEATDIDRVDTETGISQQRAKIAGEERGTLDRMAALFEAKRAKYREALQAETANVRSVGKLGARAVFIDWPVDSDGADDLGRAAMESFGVARARIAVELLDGMLELSGSLKPHDEQVAAYALLGLSRPERLDTKLVYAPVLTDDWLRGSLENFRKAGYSAINAYAKGRQVAPIDGGQFNIASLVPGL